MRRKQNTDHQQASKAAQAMSALTRRSAAHITGHERPDAPQRCTAARSVAREATKTRSQQRLVAASKGDAQAKEGSRGGAPRWSLDDCRPACSAAKNGSSLVASSVRASLVCTSWPWASL